MDSKKKYLLISLVCGALVLFALYFILGKSPSEYEVLFDSDGGSTIDKQIVKAGEKVVRPSDPVKDGYSFSEWQLDGKTYNFESTVSNNITLKALWGEIIKHSVKVVIDGIEYMADISDGEPITIDALNIPNKDGFKVVFYNQNNEEYDISMGVTSDISLTAKYVEIKKYTVKFDSQGGSKVADAKVVDGELVSEPTTTKKGYVLDGWYNGNTKYDFSLPVKSNITLKAKWIDGEKITVTFNVDEKEYKSVKINENSKVTPPANPAKKGYKFVEWQLDNAKFDFNTKINTDTILTAVFKETKSYTVSFNSDGGSKIETQEVAVGGKVKEPDIPTKEGYVFVEWQLNGKKYAFTKEVIEDLNLKAKWKEEIIEFTVKFDSSGGSSIADQVIKKGEKVKKPNNPTKNGYTFDLWLLNNVPYDFSKEVTENITLVAYYKVNPTPTPAPTATPTPATYTITATKADNMASTDSILKVYKNDQQISVKEIQFSDGTHLCDGSKLVVMTSDIVGETTFIVVLNDNTKVRATLK